MKSLLTLWKVLAQELGEWCHASTDRDFKTVAMRVENEGLSFLTITLSDFAADFDEALSSRLISPGHFPGFRRRGGLPVFLQGFLRNVFNPSDGSLVDNPDVDSIYAVRQLTRLYSKIALPCSDERIAHAFQSYVNCEKDVREAETQWSSDNLREFTRVSSLLFAGVLTELDARVAYGVLVPKHGPGATADRLLGNKKYNQLEWTRRLDEVFPLVDFLLPNARYHSLLKDVNILEPGEERPVKVITVPKTLKTPRIIAVEPTCMQYTQQAIARPIMELIGRHHVLNRLIGFTDQETNRLRAKIGSVDGSLATLDLSEASDRVSNLLVENLLSRHPHLRDGVAASRSLTADVPGHGVIPLSKFASMGSALCFPIEAMVFLTIVFMGIQDAKGTLLQKGDIIRLAGKVRIFGDDIIVPREYAYDVIRKLEFFGLKVNRRKSFYSGNFRESCGKDYYDGHDVTTVKVRQMLPSSRRDAQEIVSTVSLRNQLYNRGLVETAGHLDDIVGGILKFYPTVGPDSPVLGRVSFSGSEPERTDPFMHQPQVKGFVVKPVPRVNTLDDVGALMKYFLNSGDLQVTDRLHLVHSGRPVAVDIKLRWAPSD